MSNTIPGSESPKKLPYPEVVSDDAGMRLDRWLRRRFPDLSQGQIQKFLRTGQIRLDGKRAEAADRVEAGQKVRLPPFLGDQGGAEGGSTFFTAQQAKRDKNRATKLQKLVLYQDEDVVALNKPAGLAVQGGTGLKENLDDDLAVFALPGGGKPKLVHRLDRDTSGVLLIARTDFAARRLAEAFRDRATRKLYWALTVGVPSPEEGKISAALVRDGEVMRACDPQDKDAKKAHTLYQVIESVRGKAAFVALCPLTGRTHQLRVHLAHLETPILGDRLYGGDAPSSLPSDELGKGLHLHARRLILPHPRRGMIDVTAPLGDAMKKSWRWFGFDADADIPLEDW